MLTRSRRARARCFASRTAATSTAPSARRRWRAARIAAGRCDELVDEASALAERHAEIVITGIHIGTYGADIGSSLGALHRALVARVPHVRFRLSSIEATEIDDALAELLVDGAATPRAARARAAAVRLGSAAAPDGSALVHERDVRGARSSDWPRACSVLGLGADVIAGFPGETEADHAATVALVERLPFTYLHVFPFSLRPGTAAERLPIRVSPVVADAPCGGAAGARRRERRRPTRPRASAARRTSIVDRTAATQREGLTGGLSHGRACRPTARCRAVSALRRDARLRRRWTTRLARRPRRAPSATRA